jgi:transposase-like protein
MASMESVRRWFHRFSSIFSVEERFRYAVALDETVVKMHGLRAYVWSGILPRILCFKTLTYSAKI